MENDEQTQLFQFHAVSSSLLLPLSILSISTLSTHRNQQLDGQFKILQLSVETFTAFYVNIHRDTWMEMFVQMCTDIFDGKENLFYIFRFRKTKGDEKILLIKLLWKLTRFFCVAVVWDVFFEESQRINVNLVEFGLK